MSITFISSAKHQPITPNDVTTFAPFNAIFVGGTGAVVVTDPRGLDATYSAVPSGTVLPVCGIKVKATGTTATGLVAIYAATL